MSNATAHHRAFVPPKEDLCDAGIILPLFYEGSWNPIFRAIIYFVFLLYMFVGVAIITDRFMASIEVITSKKKKIYIGGRAKKEGEVKDVDDSHYIEVEVWNQTVANLTLMAFGTSAPEICLSIIEVVLHNFEAGALGPGTIVGSAAFNLLVITSICMVALDDNDTRRIERYKVFVVTTIFAIFAYIWLFFILSVSTEHVVVLWEAIVTLIMFPTLIFLAWAADQPWCGVALFKRGGRDKGQIELGPLRQDEEKHQRKLMKAGKINRELLAKYIRDVKKHKGITDEDAALLAAAKMVSQESHTAGWYRMGAVRNMTGSRKLIPELDERLKEIYHTMGKEDPLALQASTPNKAVVEFNTPMVAVKESIGTFPVCIRRGGNLDIECSVRVMSLDGTAKRGEDYTSINEIVTFEKGQKEKWVMVTIKADNRWEPDEEFYLRLSTVADKNRVVEIGKISIMEITIIDDDNPGLIAFEKRAVVVKESVGVLSVEVRRTVGSDGKVSVKWRTIDRSAISGRDYKGGSGELTFAHGEVMKKIDIPIIDDMQPEKDEHFDIELFSPTGGSRLGKITKCAVTITNDDDFYTLMDRLTLMTHTNLDAIKAHKQTWCQQIKESMQVNGGDLKNAKSWDYLLHYVSFFWKVLFSLVPPPKIFGGWLTFVVSLACIGVVTTIIGDIATIFGCIVGLDDTITAITLVAAGTSLPDTFASRMSLISDKNADNAVGNINGSNAVNVFMGLGIPWTAAAIYHYSQGTKFHIPSEGLGFSVFLFLIAACIAMAVLVIRRFSTAAGKAEIGGPRWSKWLTFGLFFTVWVAYVALTWAQIAGLFHFSLF